MKKIIAIILCVTLISGCGTAMSGTGGEVVMEQGISVFAENPKEGKIENEKSFIGKAYSQENAIVISSIPAKVNQIHVNVGDTVTKGQILYEVDTTDLQIGLSLSELELDMKRTNMENTTGDDLTQTGLELELMMAETAYEDYVLERNQWEKTQSYNIQKLEGYIDNGGHPYLGSSDLKDQLRLAEDAREFERQLGTNEAKAKRLAVENLERQIKNNNTIKADESDAIEGASLDLAELKHGEIEKMIADSKVYSPINGTVESNGLKLHEYATQEVVIANKNLMEISFNITEENTKNLVVGDSVSIDISNTIYSGTINSIGIAPVLSGSGLYEVKALIETNGSIIPTGAVATVDVVVESTDDTAISVPSDSIYFLNGVLYVFVIEDEKSVKKTVGVGVVSNGRSEITSGISKEDVVIINKSSSMAEGKLVTIRNVDEGENG